MPVCEAEKLPQMQASSCSKDAVEVGIRDLLQVRLMFFGFYFKICHVLALALAFMPFPHGSSLQGLEAGLWD